MNVPAGFSDDLSAGGIVIPAGFRRRRPVICSPDSDKSSDDIISKPPNNIPGYDLTYYSDKSSDYIFSKPKICRFWVGASTFLRLGGADASGEGG